MRRNVRVSKASSIAATNALHFGGVVLTFAVMAILHLLASSNCDQLQKCLREKENRLARLEAEKERVSAGWEQLKTPEQLEMALLRHSKAMHYTKPAQVIRMRTDGTPVAGQYSVAKAEQRLRRETAMVARPVTSASRGARRR